MYISFQNFFLFNSFFSKQIVYPDPVASKTLTLVVKTVQKIANLSAFDQGDCKQKKAFFCYLNLFFFNSIIDMDRMNELIHNKIEPMKVFLTEIAVIFFIF